MARGGTHLLPLTQLRRQTLDPGGVGIAFLTLLAHPLILSSEFIVAESLECLSPWQAPWHCTGLCSSILLYVLWEKLREEGPAGGCPALRCSVVPNMEFWGTPLVHSSFPCTPHVSMHISQSLNVTSSGKQSLILSDDVWVRLSSNPPSSQHRL